jgi:hypothetical protein
MYFSGYKKSFGINVQAICDADLRFLIVTTSCPGSVNDYFAFTHDQKLMDRLSRIPFPYYILGDPAYPLLPWLITPFSDFVGNREKDAFNFFHSQSRIVIERAFGLLVAKWGILWRPLRFNMLHCNRIVHACVRLHNFLIDQGVAGQQHALLYSEPYVNRSAPSAADGDPHGEAIDDVRYRTAATAEQDQEPEERATSMAPSSIRSALFTQSVYKSLARPPASRRRASDCRL